MEVWGGSSRAEHLASVPGLDISVTSTPQGGERGGDIYLISSCSSGNITRVLLADVSGHGARVSDLASKLRRLMHKSINTIDQSRFARTLNEAFEDLTGDGLFATALLISYFSPTRHLVMVNAGHPPPLLRRAGSKGWAPLDADTPGAISSASERVRVAYSNLPLGVISSTQYEQIAIQLNEGDRVCAYTDAYSEATRLDSSQIGIDGLRELMGTIGGDDPAVATHTALELAMNAEGITLGDDDRTLITLENNGGQGPRVTLPVVGNWLRHNLGLGHTDTTPE